MEFNKDIHELLGNATMYLYVISKCSDYSLFINERLTMFY